ncbi:hypothetical protein ACYSNU_03335 [Enterococcus sp. LJL120]
MGWFFNREKQEEKERQDASQFRKVMQTYQKYAEFPYINPDESLLNERIQQLATGAIPFVEPAVMERNQDGYLLGELILLDWLHGKSSEINDFPDYFELKLGINAAETVMPLLDDDCLDILEDEGALYFWPLEELNDLAEEYGLERKATYDELIASFKAGFTPDFLADLIGRGVYVPMEYGQQLLTKYQADFEAFQTKHQL